MRHFTDAKGRRFAIAATDEALQNVLTTTGHDLDALSRDLPTFAKLLQGEACAVAAIAIRIVSAIVRVTTPQHQKCAWTGENLYVAWRC